MLEVQDQQMGDITQLRKAHEELLAEIEKDTGEFPGRGSVREDFANYVIEMDSEKAVH